MEDNSTRFSSSLERFFCNLFRGVLTQYILDETARRGPFVQSASMGPISFIERILVQMKRIGSKFKLPWEVLRTICLDGSLPKLICHFRTAVEGSDAANRKAIVRAHLSTVQIRLFLRVIWFRNRDLPVHCSFISCFLFFVSYFCHCLLWP